MSKVSVISCEDTFLLLLSILLAKFAKLFMPPLLIEFIDATHFILPEDDIRFNEDSKVEISGGKTFMFDDDYSGTVMVNNTAAKNKNSSNGWRSRRRCHINNYIVTKLMPEKECVDESADIGRQKNYG